MDEAEIPPLLSTSRSRVVAGGLESTTCVALSAVRERTFVGVTWGQLVGKSKTPDAPVYRGVPTTPYMTVLQGRGLSEGSVTWESLLLYAEDP